ncbi:PREDICTED: trichohyalin-like [Papilio polytes]|uniref:trichohyalin-like n=1 Tax=Papilio polytes TaxID=76194 RepID=UPI00067619A4|nr:PREDICTED: trichohyalin-like [Papilio polytes]
MESPRRSASLSPRRKTARPIYRSSAVSDLITSAEYEDSNNIIRSIPEREWRLLTALARKREESAERDRLADEFHKMWREEKREREMIDAQSTEKFRQYIKEKRRRERCLAELVRGQQRMQQNIMQGQLLDCIRYKDHRAKELMAFNDDRKVSRIIDNALEEESRAYLAADRRSRQHAADHCRRSVQLIHALQKEEEANKRRNALLRNTSQRVAISNALSSWESSLLRQELAAEEAYRRAEAIAHAAHTDARAMRLVRERDVRARRARRLADFTERLRDAVKIGQMYRQSQYV